MERIGIFNKSPRRREVGGFVVPLAYSIHVDDDDLDFTYEIDVDNTGAAPRVNAVVCIARSDQAVRAEQLRMVKIASIVKAVAQSDQLVGRPVQRGGRTVGAVYPLSGPEYERYLDARRREERAGRRTLTDEDYRHVADVYRAALVRGEPPTAAVQRELRLGTRARATRWVRKARDAGYLGEAPGWRQAGELAPRADADEPIVAPLPERSMFVKPQPLVLPEDADEDA